MTTLYLIRHGETVNNVSGRYNGKQDDHPLNEAGLAQAERLSAAFAPIRLDAVYTSTLLRARQTGEILRGERAAVPLHRADLDEYDFGILSSMRYADAEVIYPDLVRGLRQEPMTTACPGGESGADVVLRATNALAEIVQAHRGNTVAVVTHGMLLQLIFAELAGLPFHKRKELSIFNTAYAKLDIEDDGHFTVCCFNRHDHLSAEDLEKATRKYTLYPETVANITVPTHFYAKFAK